MSHHRSSRAQRSLGLLYLRKGEVTAQMCVHEWSDLSLSIRSLRDAAAQPRLNHNPTCTCELVVAMKRKEKVHILAAS